MLLLQQREDALERFDRHAVRCRDLLRNAPVSKRKYDLLDDATRLAATARAVGVDVTLEVWPEMVHVFQASAGFVPEADEAIAHIAAFCRPKLGLS